MRRVFSPTVYLTSAEHCQYGLCSDAGLSICLYLLASRIEHNQRPQAPVKAQAWGLLEHCEGNFGILEHNRGITQPGYTRRCLIHIRVFETLYGMICSDSSLSRSKAPRTVVANPVMGNVLIRASDECCMLGRLTFVLEPQLHALVSFKPRK